MEQGDSGWQVVPAAQGGSEAGPGGAGLSGILLFGSGGDWLDRNFGGGVYGEADLTGRAIAGLRTLFAFAPIAGEISDGAEAVTGIGPNGETLSGSERAATVVATGLPIVPGSVVRKALGVASPLVDDALDLVTRADDAADAAKDVGTLAGRSTWPNTADEMTEYLGIPGQQVPDSPITPGRDKTVWRPNSDTTITLERHPYHPDAPDWHRDYHWHLDTPDHDHQRFLPGDPIPGLEDQGVTEQ